MKCPKCGETDYKRQYYDRETEKFVCLGCGYKFGEDEVKEL